MDSIDDYTDYLRASLRQRMEHALDDKKVQVADILSSTHGQMMGARQSDPQHWSYYSGSRWCSAEMPHRSYGGPSWNSPATPQGSPAEGVFSSLIRREEIVEPMDVIPINHNEAVSRDYIQADLGTGDKQVQRRSRFEDEGKICASAPSHTNTMLKKVDDPTRAVCGDKLLVENADRTGKQKQSLQTHTLHDETEAIKRYRRLKASKNHSKELSGTANKSWALRRCTSPLAPEIGNLPGSFQPKPSSDGSNQDGVSVLAILPTNSKDTRQLDHHSPSDKKSVPKRTQNKKFSFQRDNEFRQSTHQRNEQVVIFDNWIRSINKTESAELFTQLGDSTDGKLRRENHRKVKSHGPTSQRSSKSTQTETRPNKFCKVVLFTVPHFSDLPEQQAGLHGEDSAYISAQKSKSTQDAGMTPRLAERPGTNSNFQSILENADKRLTRIERQKGNSFLAQRQLGRTQHSTASHIARPEELACENLTQDIDLCKHFKTVGTNTSPDATLFRHPTENRANWRSDEKLLKGKRPLSNSTKITPDVNGALSTADSTTPQPSAQSKSAGTFLTSTERISPDSAAGRPHAFTLESSAQDSANEIGVLVIQAASGTTKSLSLTQRTRKISSQNKAF